MLEGSGNILTLMKSDYKWLTFSTAIDGKEELFNSISDESSTGGGYH